MGKYLLVVQVAQSLAQEHLVDEVYWPLHYWIVQKQIKQNKEETVMETSCTYYSKRRNRKYLSRSLK